MAEKESPSKGKLTHAQVGYQRHSSHEYQDCGNCSMYVKVIPPACTLVEDPIYSVGWCRRWEANKRRRA